MKNANKHSLLTITLVLLGLLALVASGTDDRITPAGNAAPKGHARFLYAANGRSGDVSIYRVNPGNGKLTQVGTTQTGGQLSAIAVDPINGQYAYAVDAQSGKVSAFKIQQGTGALTSVSWASTGSQPSSIAIDPIGGKYAVITNQGSSTVSSYRINRGTGALIASGTASAGSQPTAVAIHPSGKYAYVTGLKPGAQSYVGQFGSDVVSTFRINSETGALSFIGSMPAGNSPQSIAVSPQGNYAVVTSDRSDSLTVFVIPQSFPMMIPVAQIASTGGPSSVALDASGLAVVSNRNSGLVTIFNVAPTGGINMVGVTSAGTGPASVAIDPSGVAYVANEISNNVSAIAISPYGFPTQLGAVPAGTAPKSIAIAY